MSGGGDVPIPTPVVWKDLVYFNSAHGRHAPLMAVKNSVKGEVSYPEKEAEDGDLYIAATGKEYKLLKKIPLGEASLVTPGITDGMLVLRTASRLIAVSSQ